MFLYGSPPFGVLAGLLAGGGVALALWGPGTFRLGGWATGVVLGGAAFLLDGSAGKQAR